MLVLRRISSSVGIRNRWPHSLALPLAGPAPPSQHFSRDFSDTSFKDLGRTDVPPSKNRNTVPAALEEAVRRARSGAVMDRAQFLEVYQKLKAELLADSELFKHTPESRAWCEKSLEHNVPGGKLNRGLSVVDSAATLVVNRAQSGTLSEEEKFQAASLGWCIEWLQGYFLVMDDIMDKSVTRRGKPCWYKMPKVGLIAINDAILLNSHIFLILQRHFSAHPQYPRILQLFNEVTYQTACGQMLDLITTPEGELDLTKYTMDTYVKIVQYKTAYYSFYLPVASAMLVVNQWKESEADKARAILVEMGTYFQVQDDVLDCFGDPVVIGKIGTDIEDSKCSWLVVTALQRATPEQRAVIEAHYGKSDAASVATIKQLYKDMKLQEAFEEYEDKCYKELVARFEEVDESLKAVLSLFLKKIFKRTS